MNTPYASIGRVVLRTLMVAAFIAALAVVAEIIGALITGSRFSSFVALALFCALVGFLPLQPTPSRISDIKISIWGRLLIVAETTCFVVLAMFASHVFMAYRHINVSVSVMLGLYFYLIILVISFFSNFSRLKAEIRRSN